MYECFKLCILLLGGIGGGGEIAEFLCYDWWNEMALGTSGNISCGEASWALLF